MGEGMQTENLSFDDSSAGFTLLEVLISIAILAVVGLASAIVMIPVVQAQNESREFTQATAMSRAVLEELYSRSLEDLTDVELFRAACPKRWR